MRRLGVRGWVSLAIVTCVLGGAVATGLKSSTAADGGAAAAASGKGSLTVESLGTMLSALGYKAVRTESRYDFVFTSSHNEEWNLSLSAVLSNDQKSIWIMAWLDELPKTSTEVPRKALLQLLSDNDKMGAGQFFAYVSSNKRFVLQRVIDNKGITTAGFREVLDELSKTVINTYPHWSTQNWKTPAGSETPAREAAGAGIEETPREIGSDGSSRSAATAARPAAGRAPAARK